MVPSKCSLIILAFSLLCAKNVSALSEFDSARLAVRAKNYVEAHRLLANIRGSSEHGAATYLLATLYHNGHGVPRDRRRALNLFLEAARANESSAQYMVAQYFLKGDDVEADLEKAQHWLSEAAESGHSLAKQQLQSQSLLISKSAKPDEHSEQQAFRYARSNNNRGLRTLVEAGFDVNIQDSQRTSLLHEAVTYGSHAVLTELILLGAKIESRQRTGLTPLMLAAETGELRASSILLDAGANAAVTDSSSNTLLHLAARGNNLQLLQLLLLHNIKLNRENDEGATALDLAMRKRNGEFAEALRSAGARHGHAFQMNQQRSVKNVWQHNMTAKTDLNETLKDWPLLSLAVWRNKQEAIADLLKTSELDELDPEGYSALHRAVWRGQPDTLKQLLDAGAGLQVLTPARGNALHLLARRTNANIVHVAQQLLAAGVKVALEDETGATALELAISNNKVQLARLLLDSNSQHKTASLNKALLLASKGGETALIKKLVTAGADPEYRGSLGQSALLICADKGFLESAQLLLKLGADAGANTADGLNALHKASHSGHYELAKLLVKRGELVNAETTSGFTPLMYAAIGGHAEIVRTLLANGAEIGRRNKSSFTALMLASKHGHAEAVQGLLAAGANPKRKNKSGNSAADLAESGKHWQLAQFLKNR